MSVLINRKRLPDGTFGDPEKVFGGETDQEKLASLEIENSNLLITNAVQEAKITGLEEENAGFAMRIAMMEAKANV